MHICDASVVIFFCLVEQKIEAYYKINLIFKYFELFSFIERMKEQATPTKLTTLNLYLCMFLQTSGWSLMMIRWAWSRQRTSWSCRGEETGTSPTCWFTGRDVLKSWKNRNNNSRTHTHAYRRSRVLYRRLSTVCARCAINPGVFQTPPHIYVSVVSVQAPPPTTGAAVMRIRVIDFGFFFLFVFSTCPSYSDLSGILVLWKEELRLKKGKGYVLYACFILYIKKDVNKTVIK